ncbi:tail fiber assembly protein [Xenorhabdus bovienii]|uniref:tail fiber assembly protein n=1 Tax=Xenorhabdus bovienii TaxID=40576 RepID=UPI003DA31A09
MKYTTELEISKFDEQGFALSTGWVQVYRCDQKTGEYIGTAMEQTMVGFSVSAGAYLDKPELPSLPDRAICRTTDGTTWEQVPDYRGKTAYHTKTRHPVQITEIGEIPTELTRLAPKNPFDKWNGKQWVTDAVAQREYEIRQTEQRKSNLQQQADFVIKPLQDAVDLGIATDAEKSALTEWRQYRVLLSRIDCTTAPDITWPGQPQ